MDITWFSMFYFSLFLRYRVSTLKAGILTEQRYLSEAIIETTIRVPLPLDMLLDNQNLH